MDGADHGGGRPRRQCVGHRLVQLHRAAQPHAGRLPNRSNAVAPAVASAALKHRSAGVRRNAVQVLPRTAESVTAIRNAGLIQDPDAQVRLMTLLALADLPPAAAAGETVVAVLNDPK